VAALKFTLYKDEEHYWTSYNILMEGIRYATPVCLGSTSGLHQRCIAWHLYVCWPMQQMPSAATPMHSLQTTVHNNLISTSN